MFQSVESLNYAGRIFLAKNRRTKLDSFDSAATWAVFEESSQDFGMRKVIGLRYPLGSVPIKDIELDAESRDDIPAILIGLQAVYRNEATREELFRLLDEHVLPDRRRDTGRPGMELWAIIVMGVLKQGLNCDYDRLHRACGQGDGRAAPPGPQSRGRGRRSLRRRFKPQSGTESPEAAGTRRLRTAGSLPKREKTGVF